MKSTPSVDARDPQVLPVDDTSAWLARLHQRKDLQRGRDAVRRLRQEWVDTVDVVGQPMMAHDAQGRVLRCNRAYAALAGRDSRQVIGQLYWKMFPKRDGPLPACRRVMSGGEPVDEVEFRLSTGDVYVSRSFPLSGSEGRTVEFLHVMEDVTHRLHARESVEGSERKFRALIENGSDVLAVLESGGALRYVSPSVTRVLGYEPAEVLGTLFLAFVCPDDAAVAHAALTQVVTRPELRHAGTLQFRTKSGGRATLEWTASNRLADPAVKGIVINARDVTDREVARLATVRSERYFRKLIEGGADAFYVIDHVGTVTYRSPNATQLTGWTDDDMVGKDIRHHVVPEHLARARQAIAATIRNREQATSVELSLLRKDGTRLEVEVTGRNLLDDPDVGGIVITVRDVSERKRQRDEIELKNLILATQQETSLDGILVVQDNGQVVSFNRRFVEMWGIPDEVIQSRSGERALRFACGLLVAPDAFLQTVTDLRQHKERHHREELHLKDGRAFDSYCTSMSGAAGQPLGRVWYFRDVTERLRVEQALRSSEARYRAMFDQAAVGIAQTSVDGAFVQVNSELCSMLGYSESELTGRTVAELTHPEDRAPNEAVRTSLLASPGTRSGSSIEKRYVHKDGSTVWANMSAAAVCDAQGQVECFVAIIRDISRRKQAQEAQHASHALLVSTERLARIGGFRWDIGGEAVVWSEELYRMFGRDPQEPPTLTGFMAAVHQNDRRRVQKAIEAAVAGTRPLDVDYCIVRPDATERFIHSQGVVTLDAAGRPVRLSGTSQDVTERQLAEQKLQFTNAILATQQETSLDGILVVDPHGRIISYNRRFVRMWGVSEEIVRSGSDERALQSVLSTLKDPPAFLQRVNQLYESQDEDSQDEIALLDGRVFDRYSAPMRGEDGSHYGRVWYFRDITDRKESEQQLRALNRSLRLLTDANQTLVRAGNESALLNEMTRLVVEVGGYAMAWVGIAQHDEGKTVRPVAYFGRGATDIDQLQISWAETDRGKGPTGTAIRTGTTQVNRNTETNPVMAPWRERERRLGHGSSVALPLKWGPAADAFGALCIHASGPDAFDAQELTDLEELASDIAYGVASLRTSIERTTGIDQLRRAMESAVETVAATVEARDPYTAGHQRRVAALAEAIARQLGLDETIVRGIHFGALIHDVGKIQVPAELLAKPSHLSKIELELIKNHAQAGYDIVQNIEFPWPVAEMIIQHHERVDGSGYPNGLTGDQMILEARILAVADVVEAMSSHRPYRPTIGPKMALAEIERGRGSLYDAEVVDACLMLFREKRFAFGPTRAPAQR